MPLVKRVKQESLSLVDLRFQIFFPFLFKIIKTLHALINFSVVHV